MKVTDQSVTGTTYFDNAAGRISESEVQSKMTIEITTAGVTIESKTESQVLMKLVLVDTPAKPK